MLLFLKKKTEEADEKPAESSAAQAARLRDFIPFHCHYNPHTLLTKNGELLQIIRIASNTRGLDYESGSGNDAASVRQTIRRALFDTLRDDRFSLWIHTVRRRRDITHEASFAEPFAAYVRERWQQKHQWRHQYYNEIYISILRDGQASDLVERKALKQVVLPKPNRKFRNAFLDEAYIDLDATVSAILEKLRVHYNAQRLSVVERLPDETLPQLHQPIFYSEPMEFLGSIVNLRPESFPLPDADISEAICTTALTFGFNALEAKSPAGKRRFASLLTLKQYREVPTETADRILQSPIEFIITEAFHFVDHREALSQYREQKKLFDMSQDSYAARTSGLVEMLKNNKKRITDYGKHQVSIMVLTDDYKRLDGETAAMQNAFGELGLLTIREDIRLEECFWAQLPGNFEFIRRATPINSTHAGGFCRLNRFPSGTENGNHWGNAVSLLPTMVNSPYFFNFHYQDNGHTLLLDFNSFNDPSGTILLNFLLSETRQYNNRLYLFDRDHSAQLFFSKLGGDYHDFPTLTRPKGKSKLGLNPFTLEDSPRNRSFLLAWCMSLLSSPVSDAQKESLRAAIARLVERPMEERSLPSFAREVASIDSEMAAELARWYGTGPYAGLFDAVQETLDLAHPLHGFDMTSITQHAECIIPMFSYLLHRIIAAIDGRPTLIVLHEACDLLENAFFAPRLDSLLEMLQQNNVAVIATTKKPADKTGLRCFATLRDRCGTRIVVPDDVDLDYAAQNVGLSAVETRMLSRMEREQGDFLLIQGGESIGLKARMLDFDDVHAIFANDNKNLAAAGGKFAGAKDKEKP